MIISDARGEKLQELDDECYTTLSRAYRKNTLKNLRSQALIYHRFCMFYGLKMFPADEWQLVRFARYLGNSLTSAETVQNYLSGVRTLHRIGGYSVPDASSPNLALMIRALKFELAHATKQAKPLTPRLLFRIYQHINLSEPQDLVAFCALLIGFYLFLRASNLVPVSQQEFNPQEQLTNANVRMYKNITIIDVGWSKTIQYKEKVNSLPLIPVSKKEICPTFWVHVLEKVNGGKPDTPLFSYLKEGELKILTYAQLTRKLKDWVAAAGEDAQGFSLHGLRRGGCSWALQSGLVGQEIQLMGDWASLAYFRYLDTTTEQRIQSMVKFAEHVEVAAKCF